MNQFNEEYSLYTPYNEKNLIWAMRYYFDLSLNGQKVGTTKNCNDDTISAYLSIYNNKIFPLVDPSIAVEDYSEEDLQSLLNRMQQEYDFRDSTIKGTYHHLIFKPYELYVNDVDNLDFTRMWRAARQSLFLGQNDFNACAVKIKKTLDYNEECHVAEKLLRSYDSDQGELAGLTLMFLACLRNNESAAIDFKDVVEMPHHPGSYELLIYKSTIRNSSRRKGSGKSENAPRRIPVPNVLHEYLEKRKHYLEMRIVFPFSEDGETYQSVDDLPVACRRNEYGKRCSSNMLSKKGKELFRSLGMERRFKELDLYMHSRIGTDEDFGERDATTYVFRRNGGTHLYALGIPMSYIQYYMGHKIEDLRYKRGDFADESLRYEIKERLDGHPLNNFYCIKEKRTYDFFGDNPQKCLNTSDAIISLTGLKKGDVFHIAVKAKEFEDKIRLEIESGQEMPEAVNFIESSSSDNVAEVVNISRFIRRVYN